jgi:hypothetical protein
MTEEEYEALSNLQKDRHQRRVRQWRAIQWSATLNAQAQAILANAAAANRAAQGTEAPTDLIILSDSPAAALDDAPAADKDEAPNDGVNNKDNKPMDYDGASPK